MDNVYKGFSFIVCLTIVTMILIATFRPHTAGLLSGDIVDLLSRTVCATVVVSDWCITNHAHGWWVSIQSIVGVVRRKATMSEVCDTPITNNHGGTNSLTQ